MAKCFLLCFLFLFSLHTVSAQFKETDFQRYTVADGLSDNNVYCISQDSLGYMWIGTEMGLNCFDGENFKHYFSRSKPLYLAASNISKLIPFSNDRLGVITKGGFQVINTRNLSVENYCFPDTSFFSDYNNGIMDAIELPDRSVLLSSATGIYDFDKPGHISFRYDKYTVADAGNKRILYGRDIVSIDKSDCIIYTEDYKLDRFDSKRKILSHIQPGLSKWSSFYPEQTHGSFCTRISQDQFIIFNAYSDSLTFYDRSRNLSVTSRLPCMETKELDWESSVFVLNDNSFAMISPRTGYFLFYLNKKTGLITCNPEKFLPSYKCNYLFIDNENRLWVGTRTGLLRQSKNTLFVKSTFLFNDHDSGSAARLSSIYRYKDKLYIGSYNRFEGLYILDTATMQVLKKIRFFGGNNGWSEIGSIQRYHKDTLWMGTTNGLLWMDVNSYRYGIVKDNRGDSVLAGAQPELRPPDRWGRAWLFDFMNGKAGYYDTAKRTFTFFTLHTKPALPFASIKHIVYDAYGDVWLAGLALARYNNATKQFDTMMNVYAGPKKFKNDIIAITADKKGSLWLYNAENVLLEYKIKEKRFYEHGADEGLPTFVQSMADEVNDKLWFTTGSRLICFNTSTKQVVFFDQADGLPIERASTRSIYYDKERNCYYSLHNNYLATFPADIPATQEKNNRLLFTEIAFADTILYNPSGTLSIQYNRQNFSIHFAVLNYDQPHSYNFFYSIDGRDWINLDGQEMIFFNRLSPGETHIRVKAVSKLGKQFITGIYLKVVPPFWKRWWFVSLICLAVVLIFYSLYRYRINQIIKLQKIRNNIARDLHDDIASTMGSINMYSEIAHEKINKQPMIADEILQKIGVASRQMIDRMSDIVWSINSGNDYLESLTDRMKSFCSMMVTTSDIDFQFNVNDTFSGIQLSMDKRKNIFLIFKESIYNIVKYSACKKVIITIAVQQKIFIMVIKDDGKGFDVKNYKVHDGNGLKNMKERANDIHALLNVSSAINEGTTVELKLAT
jgi:ligand-binding sensor domain-containing protein